MPINTIYDDRELIIDGDIAKLPIGINAKDGYALVDKKFAYLGKYKWSLCNGYPRCRIGGKSVKIHKLIIQTKNCVDHINRNKLDNRESNLRVVAAAENNYNKTKQSNNTSGYKGVYRRGQKLLAKIVVNGKQHHLGTHDTPEQAAISYNKGSKRYFGDFGVLNIIKEN
jgi:hypothetical protein